MDKHMNKQLPDSRPVTDRLAIAVIGISVLLMLAYEIFGVEKFILKVDPYEYYTYLPKWFIDHDFSYGSKYPIGVALLEMPFFLLAHWLAEDKSGYGLLYQYSVGIAAVFYYALGSCFIYKTLKKWFDCRISALVIALLTAGTFLPLYATRYGGFSHIFTYAMAAIFIYAIAAMEKAGYEEKWYKNLLFGMLVGLIFDLRNVNIFFLVYYLLYGLGALSRESYINRLKKVFRPGRLVMNLAGFALPVFLQLLSWKLSTGHWITNSYGGETFAYLTSPKIYEILLGDAKGLLMDCPVLIFAIIGIFLLGADAVPGRKTGNKTGNKAGADARIGTMAVLLIEIAISSTWWCWWFGGVYGMRPFIDIFPFMALGMAAFLQWVADYAGSISDKRRRIATIAFWTIVILAFVLINAAYMYGEYSGTISQWLSNAWELRQALKLR